MDHLLTSIGNHLGSILFWGFLASIGLTEYVLHYLRNSRRDAMEATLKLEMIQRGMSADEIERVLSARMPTGRSKNMQATQDWKPAPVASEAKA